MPRHLKLVALAILAAAPAAAQTAVPPAAPTAAPRPPVARVVPRADTTLGDVRVDNYFWLRDDKRQDTAVINYLEAENRYTQGMMRHTEALQERLFQEMRGRIKETDLSVPYRLGEYFYYSRTEAGKQYPIFARKRGSLTAPEEVMLDANQMAQGTRYFALGGQEVSPDGRLLAFATDTTGAERYTLMVKDLATGRILPDRVANTNGGLVWAADNRTLFYGVSDAANRPYRILRHVLGADPAGDVVVAEEPDELFGIGVYRTKDRKFLLIGSNSFDVSEVRYLPADQPMGTFRVIRPKTPNVLYSVQHHGDRFLITTNENAPNFKLVSAPDSDPRAENWRDLVPASDSVLLDGIDVFKDYLVLYQRQNGLRKLRVVPFGGGQPYDVDFPEPIYTYWGAFNPEFDSQVVRFTYTSMVTPSAVYDFNMATRQRELKKATEVPGYDRSLYATERTWARASDGTLVPVSLVYKKPLARDGSRPLLLYAYGSYGISTDPAFSSGIVSLLDRGVVYAIAHIRGGQEMGRHWYDQGKLLNKKNTFTDFISAAEHLIAQGYTRSDRLAIRGGSAGGLLMGAVINMRPELFKAVVADVPFVDVINTMLDASIPLTAGEWLQWGDPRKAEFYGYMKSYSPYDNVRATNYPAMLVTAGLNDPRVGYWEPAKWVALLRATKTDNNPLLLRTNMGAGHGGASGRYDAIRENAVRYAFILDQFGIKQ
ncbi:MAG TPA: S9 family peptidase [Longimicrobium sp.]|nr:S9 family peptidase [Longimicrobium sp.]